MADADFRPAGPPFDRGEASSVRARMDALLSAVLAFSARPELEHTADRIVATAVDLVGARYGALAVLDEDGTTTEFAVAGLDDEARDRVGPPPSGHGVLAEIADGPLRVDDLGPLELPAGHPPVRTFLGAPLRARGVLLGRLYLAGKRSGPGFTEDDERAIVALAGAASIAVDNARLHAEARDRQRWLEATGEISSALLSGTDVVEVLRLVASRAVELTGADDALIALPVEPSGALVVTVCAGPHADALTGRRIPLEGSTSGAVLRDHAPRNVPRLEFDLTGAAGLGPALAVRLRSGSRPPACCWPSARPARRGSTSTSCRSSPLSPTRRRWRCGTRRASPRAGSWRWWWTATGSPATCTTTWCSGCSRSACRCKGPTGARTRRSWPSG